MNTRLTVAEEGKMNEWKFSSEIFGGNPVRRGERPVGIATQSFGANEWTVTPDGLKSIRSWFAAQPGSEEIKALAKRFTVRFIGETEIEVSVNGSRKGVGALEQVVFVSAPAGWRWQGRVKQSAGGGQGRAVLVKAVR